MVNERKPKGIKRIMLNTEELKTMYEIIGFIKERGISVSMAMHVLEAASGEIQIEAMERKV